MSTALVSIGIIMDGNRRWAKARGLQAIEGHKAGLEKIKKVLSWTQDAGVQEVILYVFSTENWNRGEKEVSELLLLFEYAFGVWMEDIIAKGVQIRFIGDRSRFKESLQKQMQVLEERTLDAKGGVMAIALSYGGRAEILAAANQSIHEGAHELTEKSLRAHMWSTGLADPDLIVRTGGERRLSNFLLWQTAYSELFFTDTLWPDFSKEEFESILETFAARERRYGV
jgi:undecaprenyl diphosphate synthase